MKLKVVFSIFFPALLIIACNNSNSIEPKLNFSDAIKLQKGNYWVYESRHTNPSQADIINPKDSTFIKTDSVIRNNRYYRLENQFGASRWKRDSLGYIVDLKGATLKGTIEFFAGNSTDTLYRDFEDRIVGFMIGKVEQVTVPAGTFSTICFYILEKFPEGGGKLDKNHPQYFNDQYQLQSKTWYANGVGVVKSVFYYNGSGFERNLIRYKVNK
jgi:hypothetical protein